RQADRPHRGRTAAGRGPAAGHHRGEVPLDPRPPRLRAAPAHARRSGEHARAPPAADPPPARPGRRPPRRPPDRPGPAQGPGPGHLGQAMTDLLRSWDVGTARIPARRAGAVIGLAQLPLRPLLTLLARPRWEGTDRFPATGPVIACGNHLSAFDAFGYGHLLQASGIAP